MAEDNGNDMANRRAIVLIPGIRREERFFRRDILVRNLENVESFPVQVGETVEVDGESAQRLVGKPLRSATTGGAPDIDIFEAYWADMVPEQTEIGPWKKLGRGLELLKYWVFNWGMWKAFIKGSPYVTGGLMVGGLMLVLWYVALALLVADALAKDPTLTAGVSDLPILGELVEAFLSTARTIGNWRYWALIAFFLGILKVDSLVQMSTFTKDYFENKPDETDVGLRDRLRKRVRTTLEHVIQAEYGEVIIVSHSFGTVIAVDILADWPHLNDFNRLKLVTMGSPIGVLRFRSRWLAEELEQLLKKSELTSWIDFHAKTDWLCDAIPGHSTEPGRRTSHALTFEAPMLQRFTGRTHLLYYREPVVLEILVQP